MMPPIAQRLRDAAATLPDGAVSLRSLAQAHGPAAHGSMLLLLAAPCLLPVPGVGTVLGLGMSALALSMWRGDAAHGLPRRVAEVELPHRWAQRVLRLLASTYAMAGRVSRERLGRLAAVGRCSWVAATVAVMAIVIVLPIPFGNVLPALAMMFIGVGMVFRDGVAIVLGYATAGMALLLTAGLLATVWLWGSDWASRWAMQ